MSWIQGHIQRMRIRNGKAGFSAVELIATLVASAVLAITAGSMIYYGYLGWQRNMVSTEVQRDAAYALDFMSRYLREAVSTNVTVGSGTITITLTNGVDVDFTKSGSDLIFSDGSTNTITLVANRINIFTASLASNEGVTVGLDVREGEAFTRVSTFYGFRN